MVDAPKTETLKSWREARGLTLAEAAAAFGFSGANPAETYRRYEAGLVWPRAEVLDHIISVTTGAVSASSMLATRMAHVLGEDAA